MEPEFEITDDMLAAGLAAWDLYDADDPVEWRLLSAYRAVRAKEGSLP
jgi:hypothetical protein